jgi:hypothetical protein
MWSGSICAVCGSGDFIVERSRSELDLETGLRHSFVVHNLRRDPSGLEATDLTEFMHGSPARLLACRNCGTLLREEETRSHYNDDLCDFDLMQHLYERNLDAFRRRGSIYQPLLRHHAEVVEVGSHQGAFLESAEEWGWRPIGLDIGESTSDFARKQGVTVKRLEIGDYSPRLHKPEGIFIWNCFEQLEDPAGTLRRSFEILDRD